MNTNILDRVPPSNIEAERALLGALIQEPTRIDMVRPLMDASFFHDRANGKVYRGMVKAHDENNGCDVIMLRQTMGDDWETIGGAAEIARLNECGFPWHSRYYASQIRRCAMLRGVIDAGTQITQDAYEPDAGPMLLNDTQRKLQDLEQKLSSHESLTADEVLAQVFAEMDAAAQSTSLRAIPTGFADIDHRTGGLHATDLIVLAARPSQGKTGLAAQIALNAARIGEPVLFCSLEMSSEQIMTRLLCAEAAVNSSAIRGGDIAEFNREKLTEASGRLAGLPIRFTDDPQQSVGIIASQARMMIQDGGLGVVIVDQLSLVEPIDGHDRREQQVAKLSKAFKSMARNLQVPVVLLCQINRSNEQRNDNRPTLASLRESGQIEADADVVLAIHRPGFYAKDAADETAEVLVLKNRHGPTKPDILLNWQAEFTRFSNREARDMVNYETKFDDFNSQQSAF